MMLKERDKEEIMNQHTHIGAASMVVAVDTHITHLLLPQPLLCLILLLQPQFLPHHSLDQLQSQVHPTCATRRIELL